ncbi:hypothetical protein ACHAXS_000546 [Conticribra weissflogii]
MTDNRPKQGSKWFNQLLHGIADEIGNENAHQKSRRKSRRGSLGSVSSDNGSELLEDFPNKPRRLSYCNISDDATVDDSAGNTRNDSEQEHSSVNRSQQQRKQARIVMENSTFHSYENYATTKEEREKLFCSKIERIEIMRSTMMMAKVIKRSSRKKNATYSKNHHEGIEDILEDMLPSPSELPSNINPEEVIGIDHLIGGKRVVALLSELRTQHSKAVVEHALYSDEEAVAEISRGFSRVSAKIAQQRAAYVSNLE